MRYCHFGESPGEVLSANPLVRYCHFGVSPVNYSDSDKSILVNSVNSVCFHNGQLGSQLITVIVNYG